VRGDAVSIRLPPKAAPAEGRPQGADAPINQSREALLAARPHHSPEGGHSEVAPSLPWIGGAPLCYPPSSQVARHCRCRSYVLSYSPAMGRNQTLRKPRPVGRGARDRMRKRSLPEPAAPSERTSVASSASPD
jgi:hypothetical protein